MTVVLKTTVQANCLSTTDSICHQIRKSSMDRVCVITIVLGSSYQITNIFEREIWTKVHFTQLGFSENTVKEMDFNGELLWFLEGY